MKTANNKSEECILCDEHRLLSVMEVIEILGVNRNTLYRWLREGKIEQVYLGPKITRVVSKDLMEFINKAKEAI